MATALEAAFWISAAALLYGYAGYPALVALIGAIRPRSVHKAPITPRVSLLIAAYDEEEAIEERLENALSADYPPDALEVIVASDGSTDATEAIVSETAERVGEDRVRLLSLPRRGKAHALNEAARRARGEILVFSDANTEFEPDALRMLVRSFADPEVGGVAGRTMYRPDRGDRAGRSGQAEDGSGADRSGRADRGSGADRGSHPPGRGGRARMHRADGQAFADPGPAESAGRGESLYWKYDTRLKELESRTGSVVSAHGGMYAVRRELFRPLEEASVTDDFAISTGVVAAGRRLVFEREARAWERPVRESAREFQRRVRLMTRGLQGVLLRRGLLDPFRHGFYAVSLFSRKILRRILCVVLPVLLVSSVALAGEGALYAAAAWGQVVFYGLAGAGWALRRSRLGRTKLLYVPFFYCLANLASLAALANLVRGKRIERWSPQRHGGEPRGGRGGSGVPVGGVGVVGAPAQPAVVIGIDCPTGLQTARILEARGIPVFGVAADARHPCARTWACQEVTRADPAKPELIDTLHELAVRIGGTAVLFPCTDAAVLHLARERDQLPPSFQLVLPAAGVIEALLDKGRFQALARRRGYPVPETRLLETREDAVDAARSLGFPCALKPPVKTPRWESLTSAKVFKASTPEALIELYDRFSGSIGPLVVQEWIEGPPTAHVTCNCYFGRSGEPLVHFTTRKLRNWPLDGGQASLSEEWREEGLRDLTLRIFRDVGHRGFGYLEFKWDERKGRYAILEANVGRPTGRSATAEAAGVEFLLTAYCDALDLPLPPERRQRFEGVKWVHLRHDLQASLVHFRRGELGVLEWWRSLQGPRAHALFSLRDPDPFIGDVGRAAGKLARGALGGATGLIRRGGRAGREERDGRERREGRDGREGHVGRDGRDGPEARQGRDSRDGRDGRGVHGPGARMARGGGGGALGVSAETSGATRERGVCRNVEFLVAGVVTLRLEAASPEDIRAVERMVGPPSPTTGEVAGPDTAGAVSGSNTPADVAGSDTTTDVAGSDAAGDDQGTNPTDDPATSLPTRDPDIRIRYVDRLSPAGLRFVQDGRSGYTDEDFFLLGTGSDAAARLRLGGSGDGCEIVCPRGHGAPPLLGPLVDLMALKRGWAPLHASAWEHRGVGVLAAGWDRSGKTGALLAFADRGASFVGDDRVMVHGDGRRMRGIRRPLTVRGWHVSELPGLGSRVGLVRASLARLGPWMYGVQRRLPSRDSGGGLAPRVLSRVLGRLRRRLSADLPPEAVFGEEGCPCDAPCGVTFLLLAGDDPAVRVEPMDPAALARRLAATVRAELQPLVDVHLALQFAFPDRRWPLLDRVQEVATEILEEALRERPAYAVRHPYPCSLPELYRAMEAVVRLVEHGAATGGTEGPAAVEAGPSDPRSGEPDSDVRVPAAQNGEAGRSPSSAASSAAPSAASAAPSGASSGGSSSGGT